MKKPTHPLTRIMRTSALTGAAALGLLSSFQSRLIYFPSAYTPEETTAFDRSGGERLDFTTSQGKQTAWLIRPANGEPPERIWIVTAGNGSVALDFADLPWQAGLNRDAFVLVDYPGYGICEGKPHPDSIRESIAALGPVISRSCGLLPGMLSEKGIAWGHSLGAAAALMVTEEYGLKRAVLMSPFTSTMDMTKEMFGVSLGWLVRHRYDNRTGIASLAARGGKAWIIHGSADEVIPVKMGRELAEAGGKGVVFNEVKGARHNTLMSDALPAVAAAMAAARENSPVLMVSADDQRPSEAP